jgi:hypothetical protein
VADFRPSNVLVSDSDVKQLLKPVSPLIYTLAQWCSTFFVRVPPDIISLQLCTPKVVGV